MAKQAECLPPVTIGGIRITAELLTSLNALKDYTPEVVPFFTEQCMIIATMDHDSVGLNRKELFDLFLAMHQLLQALFHIQERGDGGIPG